MTAKARVGTDGTRNGNLRRRLGSSSFFFACRSAVSRKKEGSEGRRASCRGRQGSAPLHKKTESDGLPRANVTTTRP